MNEIYQLSLAFFAGCIIPLGIGFIVFTIMLSERKKINFMITEHIIKMILLSFTVLLTTILLIILTLPAYIFDGVSYILDDIYHSLLEIKRNFINVIKENIKK